MPDNNNTRIVVSALYSALCIAFLFLVSACDTTKYVADGDYLLNRVYINGDCGDVSHDDLMDYVRQQPNVRVLGFWRLKLGIYNLSGTKDNGWNRWLRKIGSAPVVYDSTLMTRSREQLDLYMQSRGYFDVVVSDTMAVTDEKKCAVYYTLDAGEVYKISHLGYYVYDDSIRPLVMADTASSLLQVGDAFDSNVHDAERARITRNLNDNGYYHFGKDYIYFVADSSLAPHQIADSLILVNALNETNSTLSEPHRKSVIDNIYFIINRAGREPTVLSDTANATQSTFYDPYTIYHKDDLVFKPSLLSSSCFVKPGQLYRITDSELTQSRFNSLKLFGSTNIKYYDKPDTDTTSYARALRHLDCAITLNTNTLQSYSIDVEGTNSSGNLGGAANIRYQHKNLFRGAEVFDIKFRIATQNQFARDGKERFFTLETGIETSLTIPKLLAPFGSEEFHKRRNPSTVFTAAYDYQRRPDFTRTVVSTKFAYAIHGSKYVQHTITPTELNVVNIPVISSSFQSYIDGTYLQYSYTDHFIWSCGYAFLFNQQKSRKSGNAWYVRFAAETAGNVLSLLTNSQETNGEDEYKSIWGIRFSQYVKTDLEVRYQVSDFWMNNFVYRFYAGVGIPYGNSSQLPFEKRYFVGGANSIRAWPVRGLGPGSAESDSQLRYHNQTSDIRLELNAEYRYQLFSIFEGAIFADAGNIWAWKRSANSDEEVLSSDFLKQVALGAGLGLRLNFDYFILRFDAAVKLHDPMADGGKRWVIATEKFTGSSINYNFAIGYPF